jgi:hypothetical protein
MIISRRMKVKTVGLALVHAVAASNGWVSMSQLYAWSPIQRRAEYGCPTGAGRGRQYFGRRHVPMASAVTQELMIRAARQQPSVPLIARCSEVGLRTEDLSSRITPAQSPSGTESRLQAAHFHHLRGQSVIPSPQTVSRTPAHPSTRVRLD